MSLGWYLTAMITVPRHSKLKTMMKTPTVNIGLLQTALAKKRLAGSGISLDLLKTLHFWAFAFDFEEFKNSLKIDAKAT